VSIADENCVDTAVEIYPARDEVFNRQDENDAVYSATLGERVAVDTVLGRGVRDPKPAARVQPQGSVQHHSPAPCAAARRWVRRKSRG
jgi:hypothetical protein